jgi:hypothetical protein
MSMELSGDQARIESILWRGIVMAGHEACRVILLESGCRLEGSAVFSHEGQPCHLEYQILCDANWRTRSAQVKGWVGKTEVGIHLEVYADQRWRLNGIEQPAVTGCIDLDLNFSPSTNLFPIRWSNLEIGKKTDIRAAWLRFPSFTLEPLLQEYHRTGETNYRYESGGGRFTTTLTVNQIGFVVDYPGIWQAEASTS